MKKTIIFIIAFTLFCTMVSAQSAENVTEMIEAETVTLNDVAYFAATYLGISADDTKKEDSLLDLNDYAQFPKIADVNAALTYDEFSYFCTQVWNIQGGVMLRLTNAPRYAFKELQSLGYIGQSINPKSTIDGVQALTIITQVVEYSLENGTIDIDSFLAPNEIDFGSSFLR